MRIKIHFSGILVILVALLCERADILLVFIAAAVLHELGHLLATKTVKKRVERIEIGFSGARIVIGDPILGYGEEFFIALMGPLFNFLALGAAIVVFVSKGESMQSMLEGGMRFLECGAVRDDDRLAFFALSSAAQAFLNLLPIRTLDGGRMLYCIVSLLFGERAGVRAIGISTAIVAFCVWTVALYLMLRAGAGLSLFVFAVWVFLGIAVRRGRED